MAGNVRQLENISERMVALTSNRTAIMPTDLHGNPEPGRVQLCSDD
jgi:transcriptional regulator with PAS, ATPase and Fis domain